MTPIGPHDALLIVDVQRDFLPGGALAVPHGDAVVPVLNRYIDFFARAGQPIFATRDWHPSDHCSFRSRGGPWPPHCIAGTEGARFAADLLLPSDAVVVSKADRSDQEGYSGFEGTELEQVLRRRGVQRLWIGGLATDYCVLSTVRDALQRGFDVRLLVDAIRPVEVEAGDGERAIEAMLRGGAEPTSLD